MINLLPCLLHGVVSISAKPQLLQVQAVMPEEPPEPSPGPVTIVTYSDIYECGIIDVEKQHFYRS